MFAFILWHVIGAVVRHIHTHTHRESIAAPSLPFNQYLALLWVESFRTTDCDSSFSSFSIFHLQSIQGITILYFFRLLEICTSPYYEDFSLSLALTPQFQLILSVLSRALIFLQAVAFRNNISVVVYPSLERWLSFLFFWFRWLSLSLSLLNPFFRNFTFLFSFDKCV